MCANTNEMHIFHASFFLTEVAAKSRLSHFLSCFTKAITLHHSLISLISNLMIDNHDLLFMIG